MEDTMNNQTFAAYAEVKILWTKMCRAMNIDPKSQFVAGIPTTAPYYTQYNAAMNRFQVLANAEKLDSKANDLDGDEDHYSTSELAHYRAIEASKEIL